ncbi:MAG: hypothetical protein JW815_00600 [Candidatus Bathyarchaeota archaeon]|nr:hypothetical protein [Candidatus Bathyarchaeum sp.]
MKKFVLGIFGLVLILSVVLSCFSNLGAPNQDCIDESVYELEPAQNESELTEPAAIEPEPITEPESEADPASPEPAVVIASPKQESEAKDAKSEQSPEMETVPEPTETDPIPYTPPVQQNYSEPVLKAINYFRTPTEPEAILWLDVMHRRFGIDEFNNALQAFDQMLMWSSDKAYVNMFRRMADYDYTANSAELGKVTNELDLITTPALYCDRLDLPVNYSTLLINGANEGGYKLTHVLLAWIWLQENGGEVNFPEGFVEEMYLANAALINTDSTITDVEMEAAAFLCLAGQNDLVDAAFIGQVIATQESDGGWGGTSKRWHTTVLGLLYLLHMEFPSDSYPPILAPN